MREKSIENKIKNYLKSKEIWYVKYFANSFTPVGIPDILSVINGRFVAIEVKNEIGKTSPLQDYNLEQIRKCGGIALVVRPQNFEEFKKQIEDLLNDKAL